MKFPRFCLLIPACLGLITQVHADDDKLKNDSPYGSTYTPVSTSAASEFTPKVRLAVDYGIAHIYGESKDEGSSYSDAADDLRTGGNLKLSGEYMVTPKIGLGVAYSHFASSTSVSSMDVDMSVDFVGVILSTRTGSSGAAFVSSLMLGQSSFEEKFSAGSESISAKGTGFGFGAALGGEFYFTPHVALALEINTFNSTIKNEKLLGEDLGDNNVSNIGASGGLRVYL